MTTRSLALLVFVTCLATGSMVTHSHSLASATQGSCVDDVRIEVWDPADPNNNYYLKDPPNYSGDDEIRIYYDVYNDSCTEVGLRVDLVGSESGATILNAEMTPDPCLKSWPRFSRRILPRERALGPGETPADRQRTCGSQGDRRISRGFCRCK